MGTDCKSALSTRELFYISARSGSTINANKSTLAQTAGALQCVGDSLTAIGIVTAQPEIVAAGGVIGKFGLGVGIADNFANNGFNTKTVTDALVKVSISVALDKIGDAGVSATRRVAGEEAVKTGGNKVSESIIQANTMAAEKIVDKIVEDK